MIALTQKSICPFCFSKFSLQEIRFRCLKPGCPGRALDPVFAQARGYTVVEMGRVLVPNKRVLGLGLTTDVECDTCHTISRTRLCPICHFELSHDVGRIDQRIIAIIGGRNTGKTHYIASLITRLKQEVGKNFEITVRMLGDHTQERWDRDFYTPLFVRKTVLQPTRPAEIDSAVKSPLIFRLTFDNGATTRAINISFFDSAGEDMTSLNTMSIQNRYICFADGIIFLLDPLQIAKIRQRQELHSAAVNVPPQDPKASPENIVGRLRDLFEREYNLRAAQKIKVPVAFTLSKIDALKPILEPGSELLRHSEHFGRLDLDDIQSVSTEIANYLSEWIDPNFLGIVDKGFANYRYFGVSSLGEPPDVSNHLLTISPLRVEDPFLWILYKLGLIRGLKAR